MNNNLLMDVPYRFCAVLSALLVVFPTAVLALQPQEIVVLANRRVEAGGRLAVYYAKRRDIPATQIVWLDVTSKETCPRSDYEDRVARPVREYLSARADDKQIRCLVVMYGLPLKIAPPELSESEKQQVEELRRSIEELERNLSQPGADQKEEHKLLKQRLKTLRADLAAARKADYGASLDSELMLVLKEIYPLSGWVRNPHFLSFQQTFNLAAKEDVLMVSRLDGPSPEIVARIIDDSIDAERGGLQGTAYFDARWPDPGEKPVSGYALYDRSIHKAAQIVRRSGRLPVVLNSRADLFQPGNCPNAALYCGWYSLANYVDAFSWQPGAVGYHIASAECTTLKKPDSRVWCKMMLEKGVAATIGPVAEPYLQGFPLPDLFFSHLLEGDLSLAECYLLSLPHLSWQMVLIGDPLYRPFGRR